MDRLTSSSHIARPEPNANSEIYSDSVVIATKEKSISNKNKISINIIYSHKPAAEVFNNPELLSAAKLARSEIKKQLLDTGRVSESQLETILDNTKYGSADTSKYGEIAEKILGSANFNFLLKPLNISANKFRFDSSDKASKASNPKPRAKRATGIFQPAAIQSGRSTDSPQKKTASANTKQPLIQEESSLSEDDFVFSTFPSDLESAASLPEAAPERNKASSSSTSAGWRTAKPTTARPEPSTTAQPLPSSSANEKKS